MLGLGNTLTASDPIEGIALVEPGTWGVYQVTENDDTRYVNVRAYSVTAAAVAATNYDATAGPPATSSGTRVDMANGDSLAVQITFKRMQSTNPSATVLAETTGTAYLYRVTGSAFGPSALFHLSPVNQPSQTSAQLFGTAGSGTFNLTTFGDNGGCTPTVSSGDTESGIYRAFVTINQNPPFSSSTTFNSSAVYMDTVG